MRTICFLLSLLLLLMTTAQCRKGNSALSQHIEKDPGSLTITNPSRFIGSTVAGTTIEHTLHLFASGGLDLFDIGVNLVASGPITFKGGIYPGEGGSCTSTLSSGETCTIVLIYQPTTTDRHHAELQFTYSDPIKVSKFNYLITADSNPILSFDYGTQYDFGNKFIGSSNDLRIRLTNRGVVSAEQIQINNMLAPFSYKGGAYPGLGGNCGFVIVSGENCELVINYSPTVSGQHTQDITFSYLNNGRSEESNLRLLAWGFREAVLSISSDTGDDNFGVAANNHPKQKIFTIRYVEGDVAANLVAINDLGYPFSRIGGTCNGTLSALQGSCTIIVALLASTSGYWSNTTTFTYHNGARLIQTRKTLTGQTKEKSILSFTPTNSLNFGTVARGTNKKISIQATYHSGEMAATNISLSGLSAPFSLITQESTCGSVLSEGDCLFVIQYNPTNLETSSGELQINYHDGSESKVSKYVLSGMSEGRITSSTPSFATILAKQKTHAQISVTFNGGASVKILSTSFTGPFNWRDNTYPGSGGNCLSTIKNSCFLYVTFAPENEGSFNNSLTISYDDGVSENPRTLVIPLSAIASPAASLSLLGQSFGSTPINSYAFKTLTLSNTSSLTATNINVVLPTGFIFRGGTYPGMGGSCPLTKTLPGNYSCTLAVLFAPTNAISYSGSVTISYYDGGETRSASATLTGAGILEPSLFISPSNYPLEPGATLTFDPTFIGDTTKPDIKFRLTFGSNLTTAKILNISVVPSVFTISTNNCGDTLTSSTPCQIDVRFRPAQATNYNGTISVNYEVDGQPFTRTFAVGGRGQTPESLTSNPAAVNFGVVPLNSSQEIVLTITRAGDYPWSTPTPQLTGSGFGYKGGSYPGTGGSCHSFSGAPKTCTIYLTFNPKSIGTFSGQFKFTLYNGYANDTLIVPLSGEVKPTANLAFSLNSYDWGKLIQTTSIEKTLTLINSSSITATGLSIGVPTSPFAFKGGVYPGIGGNCGDSLAGSQTCTVVIVFSPSVVATYSQSLTAYFNNGQTNTQTSTTLRGEGIAQAIISLSENFPYNFGSTPVGTELTKILTLTNAGSVAGSDLSGSLGAPFGFVGGNFPGTGGSCTSTLNPGSTCTINLRFRPSSSGLSTGTFTLRYNDGLRIQEEPKYLQGTGL